MSAKVKIAHPKAIREKLLLSVNDTLDWRIEDGRIVVLPMQADFLKHKNSVQIGTGDIAEDIQAARKRRAERFR